MSADPNTVGRRKLLVLVGAAAAIPACSSSNSPPPSGGDNDASGSSGSSGGSSGSSGSSSSSGGSGSSSSSGSSSGSSSSSGGVMHEAGPACTMSGNILALPFSKYPQLMQAGGTASVTASGWADPVCGQSNIIVIANGPGQYVALSSSCTHACCTVSWTGSELHCPCHGATFNVQGQCTNGRTNQALPSLNTCSDATGVYVTL